MNISKAFALFIILPPLLISCSSLKKDLKETKALLKNIKTIKIKSANKKVVIDGYVLSSVDLKRIHNVVRLYGPNKIASFVHLNKQGLKRIAEQIEKEISNPNIYVTSLNGILVIEGSESYAGEKRNAQVIAESLTKGLFDKYDYMTKRTISSSSKQYILNNILEVIPPSPKRAYKIKGH
jgi:hypothetical protein